MNSLLIAALFCLGMAGYALFSGTLIMRGRCQRDNNPLLFWFGTVFYFAAGLALLGLFLAWRLKQG